MGDSTYDKTAERLEGGLAMARRLGASAAKLHLARHERIGCQFEGGRLKAADSRQGLSYEAEVLVGGRRGIASGNDPGDMEEIVARAVSLAASGSVAHVAAYPEPAATVQVKMHSPATEALTREKLIADGQSIVDRLKAHDPDLFIEAGGSRGQAESLLVTTGGVRHASLGTAWHLSAYVQQTEGTDMLFAGFGRSWRDVNEFYAPDAIARHILEDLRHGQRIADPPPAGRTDVLLCPEMLGQFLWPISLAVNGRNVVKGDSPLRGRLGEQVLDPCLTIVDDPHLDFCDGSAEIDSDGVPTRKACLFDRGVLRRFLYDLDTAGLAGAEPTGNDHCSPYSLDVPGGAASSEALLASMGDGLYVRAVIGFGQSNIINGDFSCNVGLGFRVRRGEIVGRVKNTMIAGNVYELLKADVRLSRDRDENQRMPHALIRGVSVSAGAGG